MMLLADVAATNQAVAAATGRKAKIALVAEVLGRCDPTELPVVVAWLSGSTRQRRTGLGWASLREPPPAAAIAELTVRDVDDLLQRAAEASGPGSATARRALVIELLARATAPEQSLLTGLVLGEVRQGAQAGLMLEAVAVSSGLPATLVRKATTLSGDLAAVAVAAHTGGRAALEAVGLRVGTPLSPMLAAAATDLPTALGRTGPAAVEAKLDGVRIQVHRDGTDVAVYTRTLDEITDRLPEVVEAARALPVRSAVLDGEVIALRADGRPEPFQVTAARTARHDSPEARSTPLTPVLFDLLHVDGDDLWDLDRRRRRQALATLVAPGLLVPEHLVENVDDPGEVDAAATFFAEVLARGHEGVVVKSLAAPYEMGRRGASWVKVKPRHTLDLVVLAAEWGHGRRRGWLSNLHLGARDPDGEYGEPGGFVMLGKTFKGLTDAMLTWQTERLQTLAVVADRWSVTVAPHLVVEVAFDGVQTSPRYPTGMALRFARVVAHRPDKRAAEADTVAAVRAVHAGPTEGHAVPDHEGEGQAFS
jgi:DNA ligase 1